MCPKKHDPWRTFDRIPQALELLQGHIEAEDDASALPHYERLLELGAAAIDDGEEAAWEGAADALNRNGGAGDDLRQVLDMAAFHPCDQVRDPMTDEPCLVAGFLIPLALTLPPTMAKGEAGEAPQLVPGLDGHGALHERVLRAIGLRTGGLVALDARLYRAEEIGACTRQDWRRHIGAMARAAAGHGKVAGTLIHLPGGTRRDRASAWHGTRFILGVALIPSWGERAPQAAGPEAFSWCDGMSPAELKDLIEPLLNRQRPGIRALVGARALVAEGAAREALLFDLRHEITWRLLELQVPPHELAVSVRSAIAGGQAQIQVLAYHLDTPLVDLRFEAPLQTVRPRVMVEAAHGAIAALRD